MNRSQRIALISVTIGSAAVCAAIVTIYLGRGAPASAESPPAPLAPDAVGWGIAKFCFNKSASSAPSTVGYVASARATADAAKK